jgi:hypothetical protein
MKLLTDDQLISLVEGACPEDISAAEIALPRGASVLGENWISYCVKEGILHASTVTHEIHGKVATIYWTIGVTKDLHVHAAHSLRSDLDVVPSIEAALRKLAAMNCCLSIGFETRRPGLVAKMRKYGYEIAGAVMLKKI